MAFSIKETLIHHNQEFPFDVFIQDNLKRPVIVHAHWHDSIEILYMLKGSALQVINEQSYTVNEKDIIVIRHGDVHETYCKEGEDVKILVVKFLPLLIDQLHLLTYESKYITAFLNMDQHQIRHLPDITGGAEDIRNILLGIFNEYNYKKAAYEIHIKGSIYQLISCLIRNAVLKNPALNINEKQLRQLKKLTDFIEQNYDQDITLNDAANMTNFSYHYLSKFFKKATGKNFKEYLDFVRVCEAEKMLLNQEMAISRIALEVGYNDVTCFNRMFKRVKGYSPSELKKTKSAKI